MISLLSQHRVIRADILLPRMKRKIHRRRNVSVRLSLRFMLRLIRVDTSRRVHNVGFHEIRLFSIKPQIISIGIEGNTEIPNFEHYFHLRQCSFATMFLPFPTYRYFITPLQQTTFENIVTKVEIVRNEQFNLLPECC